MEELRIIPEADGAGEGISKGLARGLLVYAGDCSLVGEGMGIGSIALRDRECTFFSRSWNDRWESGVLCRTYSLDTRMVWGFLGRPSLLLTRLIESCTGAYMRLPRLQGLLILPVHPLRSLLGIHRIFETVHPRGSVAFTYRVTGSRVDVEARVCGPVRQGDTLCLLNELSAAWFTAGWDGEQPAPPPPGWDTSPPGMLPLPLFDPVHNLRFSLEGPVTDPAVPLTLCRGREQGRDLCWAGFCLELGPLENPHEVPAVRYTIRFAPGGRP